ncbi:hypothetical protein CMV_024894 [Castanea mollissima]|uniref:Clp ATPase C-terminal domain-containing protein n=1 Tax=Castanea mollissima TaxID=60419 RepID=A0A8J4V957_9ROSI|nr:hypothetical protein CMV_024894 [Castanea mollissima]
MVVLQVLTEPKNALGKQYKKLFSMNNVKLHYTEKALRLIAKKAMAKNTGARGLRSLLESILTESMYEIPDVKIGNDRIDAVVVDEESVGTANAPGCGGKILRGEGALEGYLAETKLKNSADNVELAEGELQEGESELSSRAMSIKSGCQYGMNGRKFMVCFVAWDGEQAGRHQTALLGISYRM